MKFSQTTQIGCDANGEAISQNDPLNQTTRQVLDGLVGRIERRLMKWQPRLGETEKL